MSSQDPESLTPVQQLLRLKRYETPGDDFVEDFVRKMHERQRVDLMKSSALELAWERARTYWQESSAPRWTLAGAACMAFFGFAWMVDSPEAGTRVSQEVASAENVAGNSLGAGFDSALAVDAVMIMGADAEESAEEVPMLLSRHFSGGYADDAREVKIPLSAALREEAITDLE